MSLVNLFRKEALKNQYKSAEFGEAIVTSPSLVNYAILLLLASVFILVFLAIVVPIVGEKQLGMSSHESNYYPIVFPEKSIIERHYISNGSSISKDTNVSQIRYFEAKKHETTVALTGNESGNFFYTSEPGEVVAAFAPIGKVLKRNPHDTYTFSLKRGQHNALNINQIVEVVAHNKIKHQGKIVAVDTLTNGGTKLVIQLTKPYDISLLNPNRETKLVIPSKLKNILALIKGGS